MGRVATGTIAALAVFTGLALATPAQAAFPGANGKIAFVRGDDIWTMNPSGTGQVNLTNSAAVESNPAWSPDGKQIAFDRVVGPGTTRQLFVVNADGTGATPVPNTSGREDPTWSPSGDQLAYIFQGGPSIFKINLDGTGETFVGDGGEDTLAPSWSPDGSTIAFAAESGPPPFPCWYDIVTVSAGGGDVFNVTQCGGPTSDLVINLYPNWSPDGARIAFAGSCTDGCANEIALIDPDGTDRIDLTGAGGARPAWSPDGSKIAYIAYDGADPDPGIKVVNADGTNIVDLTDGDRPDWQPIPINSYPRPKGATPFYGSLTTAYKPCTAPDRTHGPPLVHPSCSSLQMTSDYLTVGTGDSNQRPARNEGYLRLGVVPGNPATPADEADVALEFFSDDIFTKALADYTGELRAKVLLQITDKNNTPNPGGPGAATTTSIPLELTVGCTPVADPQEGSACTASTSADALAPGTVKEGRRAIWELGRVEVYDGGADGDAQTPAGDTLFATQGLFIP
jgi:WD40-like Beta Propeller Repeat